MGGVFFRRMVEEARDKGTAAQEAGAPFSNNPFPLSQPEQREAWAMGYLWSENDKRLIEDDEHGKPAERLK